MQVLKVVAEGLTTSFRYPHFVQGIQPTYHMPPPATIYGHICSALGEWIDPSGLAFAYHFRYVATFDDLENIVLFTRGSPRAKLPGTSLPKVMEGNLNVFRRQLLFKPKLTLYLNRTDWADRFSSPRYAVVLGRSQDLFTYTSIKVVELEPSPQAYLEHTLLPFEMATEVSRGYTVLMPRWLDYEQGRRPIFARYVVLSERVYVPEDVFQYSQPREYWIDPESPLAKDRHLGLVFHTFVGGDHEALRVA